MENPEELKALNHIDFYDEKLKQLKKADPAADIQDAVDHMRNVGRGVSYIIYPEDISPIYLHELSVFCESKNIFLIKATDIPDGMLGVANIPDNNFDSESKRSFARILIQESEAVQKNYFEDRRKSAKVEQYQNKNPELKTGGSKHKKNPFRNRYGR